MTQPRTPAEVRAAMERVGKSMRAAGDLFVAFAPVVAAYSEFYRTACEVILERVAAAGLTVEQAAALPPDELNALLIGGLVAADPCHQIAGQ